jgi:hypothetical protein
MSFVKQFIRYYTLREVADMLGLTYRTVYNQVSLKIGLFNVPRFKTSTGYVYGFTENDIFKLKPNFKMSCDHKSDNTEKSPLEKLKEKYKEKSKIESVRNLIIDLLQKENSKEFTAEKMAYILNCDIEVIKLNISILQEKNKPIFDRKDGKEIFYSWDLEGLQ